MPSNRDDFKKSTIETAAKRVGYRCSFPDCTSSTVGASMEKSDAVSLTGVAAHICAAAPGGKRYDETMTTEERRSIENCIWMCQTHARLIDTDEATYSVDILKEWKKEAEERASKKLADINFVDDYYRNNGENLCELQKIIMDFISDGNYEQLTTILKQYKLKLSDVYDEFILRYKIILDIYCNQENLDAEISEYILLPNKYGIDQLIELFIIFSMSSYLDKLMPYCENEVLCNIAQLVVDGKLFDAVFIDTNDNDKKKQIIPDGDFYKKIISYLSFTHGVSDIKYENGKEFCFFEDDFFFKCISYANRAAKDKLSYIDTYDKKIYDFFLDNIEKINYLDLNFQVLILEEVFASLVNSVEYFELLYSICSENVRQNHKIKALKYIFDIQNNVCVDIEELLLFSESGNDYTAIFYYLSCLTTEKRRDFLDEHKYLFAKNSFFIYQWYKISNSDETLTILERYKEKYEHDFCYNCICALCGNHEIVGWIKTNQSLARKNHLKLYVDVLKMYNEFDQLYDLSKKIVDDQIKYLIANILSSSEKHKTQGKEIYNLLIKSGYKQQGLYHNLACLQQEIGEIEGAKNNYQLEYDTYHGNYSLRSLLMLRYQTNQFIDDDYLKMARREVDAELQNIVGATLLKLRKLDAYKYFLRSLLIDEDNVSCLYGLYSALMISNNKISTDIVAEHVVCELTCENKKIYIAVHNPEILEGINANQFADCRHYSSDNSTVSSILYSKIGDEVVYEGISYLVSDIITQKDFFSRVFFSSVMKESSTIKISGENAEELLGKITDYMKEDNEHAQKVIDDFNSLTIQYPITTLANKLGKSVLKTTEFLFLGNKEKVRNNVNIIKHESDITYILSYDAVISISMLDISDELLTRLNVICPQVVKEKIESDINEELSELAMEDRSGFISYQDGNIFFNEYDSTMKRTRHTYLAKLKELVNKLPSITSTDYISDTFPFGEFVVKGKLYCENGCLALAQSITSSVLITDEQFLYAVASYEKIENAGIISLLVSLNYDLSQLLNKLKKLAKLNYGFYFTMQLYNIVANIVERNGIEDAEYLSHFLMSDTEDIDNASEYHRQLILYVYRQICSIDPNWGSKNHLYSKIAVKHYANLYPETIKKAITECI